MCYTTCAIEGCEESKQNSSNFTLHRLPATKDLQQEWLAQVYRNNLTLNISVCSVHLIPGQYPVGNIVSSSQSGDLDPSTSTKNFANSYTKDSHDILCMNGLEEFCDVPGTDDKGSVDSDDDVPLHRVRESSKLHQSKTGWLVCRICLKSNVKMYKLEKDGLRSFYEELLNCKGSEADGLAQCVCYECASLLLQHRLFKLRCQAACQLLADIKTIKRQITESRNRCVARMNEAAKESKHSEPCTEIIKLINSTDNDIEVITENNLTDITENNLTDITENNLTDITENNLTDITENNLTNITDNNYAVPTGNGLGVTENDIRVSTDNDIIVSTDDRAVSNEPYNLPLPARKYAIDVDQKLPKALKAENWELVRLSIEQQREVFYQKRESETYKSAPFKCELCFRGFAVESLLENHCRYHAESAGKFECGLCKLRYRARSYMAIHAASHALRFLCRRCGHVSASGRNAVIHDKVHQGVTYECPECNTTFKMRASYNRHRRLYHKTSALCPACGESFVSAMAVKAHVTRTHPQVDLKNMDKHKADGLHCDKCDMTFLNEEAFSYHLLGSAKHDADISDKVKMFYQRHATATSVYVKQRRLNVKLKKGRTYRGLPAALTAAAQDIKKPSRRGRPRKTDQSNADNSERRNDKAAYDSIETDTNIDLALNDSRKAKKHLDSATMTEIPWEDDFDCENFEMEEDYGQKKEMEYTAVDSPGDSKNFVNCSTMTDAADAGIHIDVDFEEETEIASDTTQSTRQTSNVESTDVIKSTIDEIKPEKKRGRKPLTTRLPPPELDKNFWEIITLTEDEQVARFYKKQTMKMYSQAPYKCLLCYRGFVFKQVFENHNRHHEKDFGPYECALCKLRFKKSNHARRHEALHAYKFQCRRCGHVTVTENNARLHEKFHEGVTFECAECNMTFMSQSTYLRHKRVYHRTDAVCRACGDNFLSPLAVKKHMTRSHPEIDATRLPEHSGGEFYCERCDTGFLNETAFNNHVLTASKHESDTGNNEEKVRRYYARMNELKSHLYPRRARVTSPAHTHAAGVTSRWFRTNKISVTCPQCDEVFVSQKAYKKHHRALHPGMRRATRFMCDLCGRLYSTNIQLQEHKVVHTGERPYACDLCGARFCYKKNVAKHLKTHSGEKPHQCVECGKQFSSKDAVKLHHKHVHLKVPWPRRTRSKPHP